MSAANGGRGRSPATLAVLGATGTAMLAAALGGVAAPLTARAATAAVDTGLMVSAITVSADYARSHTAFASASRMQCSSDCGVLLRTVDGGHSWQQAAARGWTGQPVYATGGVALTAGAQRVVSSHDGGETFADSDVATGMLDVLGGTTALTALVSTPSSDHFLLQVPGGHTTTLPAASLDRATLVFNPAYPHVAAGQPAAFLSGVDHNSGLPVVQRCDGSFLCSGGAVVGADKDVARLFVSPHVDTDHTVFAATSKGFFRSGDGGGSFTPVAPRPPGADTLITTVQGVAFTPDFDAARHTGHVLVALITVSGTSGHAGSTAGGIYASSDGAAWSHLGDASRLDSGAGAIAVTPDGRLLAAWVGLGSHGVDGGLLCMDDGAHWADTCPGGGAAAAGNATPAPQRQAAGSPAPAGAAAANAGQPAATGSPDAAAAGNGVTPVAAATTSSGRGMSPLLVVAGALLAAAVALAAWRRARRRPHGQP